MYGFLSGILLFFLKIRPEKAPRGTEITLQADTVLTFASPRLLESLKLENDGFYFCYAEAPIVAGKKVISTSTDPAVFKVSPVHYTMDITGKFVACCKKGDKVLDKHNKAIIMEEDIHMRVRTKYSLAIDFSEPHGMFLSNRNNVVSLVLDTEILKKGQMERMGKGTTLVLPTNTKIRPLSPNTIFLPSEDITVELANELDYIVTSTEPEKGLLKSDGETRLSSDKSESELAQSEAVLLKDNSKMKNWWNSLKKSEIQNTPIGTEFTITTDMVLTYVKKAKVPKDVTQFRNIFKTTVDCVKSGNGTYHYPKGIYFELEDTYELELSPNMVVLGSPGVQMMDVKGRIMTFEKEMELPVKIKHPVDVDHSILFDLQTLHPNKVIVLEKDVNFVYDGKIIKKKAGDRLNMMEKVRIDGLRSNEFRLKRDTKVNSLHELRYTQVAPKLVSSKVGIIISIIGGLIGLIACLLVILFMKKKRQRANK